MQSSCLAIPGHIVVVNEGSEMIEICGRRAGHIERTRCSSRAPSSSEAASYRPVKIAQQTHEIRERLCKESLSGGLLYLESGDQILRNGSDVFFPFRADSNFLYITGVNQPNFGCILDTDSGTRDRQKAH